MPLGVGQPTLATQLSVMGADIFLLVCKADSTSMMTCEQLLIEYKTTCENRWSFPGHLNWGDDKHIVF